MKFGAYLITTLMSFKSVAAAEGSLVELQNKILAVANTFVHNIASSTDLQSKLLTEWEKDISLQDRNSIHQYKSEIGAAQGHLKANVVEMRNLLMGGGITYPQNPPFKSPEIQTTSSSGAITRPEIPPKPINIGSTSAGDIDARLAQLESENTRLRMRIELFETLNLQEWLDSVLGIATHGQQQAISAPGVDPLQNIQQSMKQVKTAVVGLASSKATPSGQISPEGGVDQLAPVIGYLNSLYDYYHFNLPSTEENLSNLGYTNRLIFELCSEFSKKYSYIKNGLVHALKSGNPIEAESTDDELLDLPDPQLINMLTNSITTWKELVKEDTKEGSSFSAGGSAGQMSATISQESIVQLIRTINKGLGVSEEEAHKPETLETLLEKIQKLIVTIIKTKVNLVSLAYSIPTEQSGEMGDKDIEHMDFDELIKMLSTHIQSTSSGVSTHYTHSSFSGLTDSERDLAIKTTINWVIKQMGLTFKSCGILGYFEREIMACEGDMDKIHRLADIIKEYIDGYTNAKKEIIVIGNYFIRLKIRLDQLNGGVNIVHGGIDFENMSVMDKCNVVGNFLHNWNAPIENLNKIKEIKAKIISILRRLTESSEDYEARSSFELLNEIEESIKHGGKEGWIDVGFKNLTLNSGRIYGIKQRLIGLVVASGYVPNKPSAKGLGMKDRLERKGVAKFLTYVCEAFSFALSRGGASEFGGGAAGGLMAIQSRDQVQILHQTYNMLLQNIRDNAGRICLAVGENERTDCYFYCSSITQEQYHMERSSFINTVLPGLMSTGTHSELHSGHGIEHEYGHEHEHYDIPYEKGHHVSKFGTLSIGAMQSGTCGGSMPSGAEWSMPSGAEWSMSSGQQGVSTGQTSSASSSSSGIQGFTSFDPNFRDTPGEIDMIFAEGGPIPRYSDSLYSGPCTTTCKPVEDKFGGVKQQTAQAIPASS